MMDMSNEIILLKGAATNNSRDFYDIMKGLRDTGAIVTTDANIIVEYQKGSKKDDKMIDDEIVDFMKAISNGALLVVINQPNPLFSGENKDSEIVWPEYIKKLIDYTKKVEKWKNTQQVFFLNPNPYEETNHKQDKSYFTSYSMHTYNGLIELYAVYDKPRLGLVYNNETNEKYNNEAAQGLPDYWIKAGYEVVKCMNAEKEPFEHYEKQIPGWVPPCDWIMVYNPGGMLNDFVIDPIKRAIKKYNTVILFKELYENMEEYFDIKPFKFCATREYTIVMEDSVEKHLANTIVEEFYRVYLKEEDTKDETKPFKKSK